MSSGFQSNTRNIFLEKIEPTHFLLKSNAYDIYVIFVFFRVSKEKNEPKFGFKGFDHFLSIFFIYLGFIEIHSN